MARLPIGPHVLDVSEALYAALLAAGFTGAENVAISNLIQWQLLGAARSMISDADEARHTGVSAEAYWDSRASFWGTYFDWDRYPTTAAIWEAGGFDDPAGWDFERMLDRLLTGIEQLAAVSPERETRSGSDRSPRPMMQRKKYSFGCCGPKYRISQSERRSLEPNIEFAISLVQTRRICASESNCDCRRRSYVHPAGNEGLVHVHLVAIVRGRRAREHRRSPEHPPNIPVEKRSRCLLRAAQSSR